MAAYLRNMGYVTVRGLCSVLYLLPITRCARNKPTEAGDSKFENKTNICYTFNLK